MNFEVFLADFKRAKTNGRAFVVVTMVNSRGSTPQEVGARMIVNGDGYFSGTIGGGKLEMVAILKAQECLAQKQKTPLFAEWNLQTDLKMSCGGLVCLFFEIYNPETIWKIVIFGAGHVSQELVRVLLRLDCQIQCLDSRSEWLAKLPQDPRLRMELVEHLPDYVYKLSEDSFLVLATMGHATDLPILEEVLKTKNFQYVGVLGSDLKALKMRKYLLNLGLTVKKTESFFCPIGENIGNNTPAEIAISVTAQLLKIRGLGRRQIETLLDF